MNFSPSKLTTGILRHKNILVEAQADSTTNNTLKQTTDNEDDIEILHTEQKLNIALEHLQLARTLFYIKGVLAILIISFLVFIYHQNDLRIKLRNL